MVSKPVHTIKFNVSGCVEGGGWGGNKVKCIKTELMRVGLKMAVHEILMASCVFYPQYKTPAK